MVDAQGPVLSGEMLNCHVGIMKLHILVNVLLPMPLATMSLTHSQSTLTCMEQLDVTLCNSMQTLMSGVLRIGIGVCVAHCSRYSLTVADGKLQHLLRYISKQGVPQIVLLHHAKQNPTCCPSC